jgi:maltose alpha-D-glucosyltransferase/alpha-amylase
MAFHFPVMPRIYYALREEKAAPIIDILRDTPDIPYGAQWGTFLRNHDELTLEMVTTEERAAMYGWYAPDARMRANIGIRRRLASLLDGSRAELELINALLLSLPGSPYMYYGDEIGMGDNIWLPDRDAVRTPMQWTPDRNAGFSTADPGKLYLPANQSLVYHYAAVNVEAQLATSSSLLHWTRAMLAVRRRHPVFGLGSFVALDVDNPHVLAFLRVLRDGEVPGEPAETILCVNNLSSSPQATRITLPEQAGSSLADVFGGTGFEAVPEGGVLSITLGSRDFFWLQVGKPTPPAAVPPVASAAASASTQAPAAAGKRPGGGTRP